MLKATLFNSTGMPAVVQNIPFIRDDGGRAAAGFRGSAGDCVTRAIAIATELPYSDVYGELHGRLQLCRSRSRLPKNRSPRSGVPRRVYEPYLRQLGFLWTPTMQIGGGCRVHLLAEELPPGRIIVRLSKHVVAVIDGVLHDTHDCSRGGTRCVYGYFSRTRKDISK